MNNSKNKNWVQTNQNLKLELDQKKRLQAKTQNELVTAMKVLKSLQDEKTRWTKTKKDLNKDIKNWSDAHKKIKDERDKFEKDLKKKSGMNSDVYKDLQGKYTKIQTDLKKKEDEIYKLKDSRDTFQLQVDDLQIEVLDLKDKLMEAEDDTNEMKTIELELDNANDDLRKEKKKTKKLEKDIQIEINRRITAETNLKNITKTLEKANSENDQFRFENSTLVDELAITKSKLEKANETLYKNSQIYDIKLNNAQKDIQDLKSQNTILAERIQSMEQKKKSKKDGQIRALADTIDLLKVSNAKLLNDYNDLKAVHNKMKKQVLDNIANWNKKLEASDDTAKRYKKLYEDCMSNVDNKNDLILRLRSSLKIEIQKAKAARKLYLKAKGDELDCQNELKKCQNELGKALTKIQNLQDKINPPKEIKIEPGTQRKTKRKRNLNTMQNEIDPKLIDKANKKANIKNEDNTNVKSPDKKKRRTKTQNQPKLIQRDNRITPPKTKMKLDPNSSKRPNTKPKPIQLRPSKKNQKRQITENMEITIVSPNNRQAQENRNKEVERQRQLRDQIERIEDVIHDPDNNNNQDDDEDNIQMEQIIPKLEKDKDLDNDNQDDKDDNKSDDSGAGLFAGNFMGSKIIGLYDKYD